MPSGPRKEVGFTLVNSKEGGWVMEEFRSLNDLKLYSVNQGRSGAGFQSPAFCPSRVEMLLRC